MSEPKWMQPPSSLAFKRTPQTPPDRPYLSWPLRLAFEDSDASELEKRLQRNPGQDCQVAKYLFDTHNHQWVYHKATTDLKELKDIVLETEKPRRYSPKSSFFLMASSLQDEAIRSLGFWMNIAPSFFVLPSVHLRVITGTRGDIHLMFSLQYMSKYPSGHTPSESQRSAALPPYRFLHGTGQQNHEWHVNHARLIFFTGLDGDRSSTTPGRSHASDSVYMCWRGLYMFDQDDDSIATSMRSRLVAHNRESPRPAEVYQGLGQIIQDVIYLISVIRTEFFDEAMLHLQVLSKQCLDNELDPAKQLKYLRELYDLFPLWSQVRRQLDGTKNLVAQVSRHEISSFSSGERDDRYYVKRLSVVEDQLRRCNDAADKTKNLISLITNIASLQESRAAVQESRSANAFAESIKRVTILTFIYLPLTLASSILGMNITQITGEGTHSQLWLYFVLAVALMAATFGGWFISSINFKDGRGIREVLRKMKVTDRHDDPEAPRLKSWSTL